MTGWIVVGVIVAVLGAYMFFEHREMKRVDAFADVLNAELNTLHNQRVILTDKNKTLEEVESLVPRIDVMESWANYEKASFTFDDWKSLIVYKELDG